MLIVISPSCFDHPCSLPFLFQSSFNPPPAEVEESKSSGKDDFLICDLSTAKEEIHVRPGIQVIVSTILYYADNRVVIAESAKDLQQLLML